MHPIPKNSAQEFFKTLFIKLAVDIRDVLLNQVLIVTSLRIFEFQIRVNSNGCNNNQASLKCLNTWLFFNY